MVNTASLNNSDKYKLIQSFANQVGFDDCGISTANCLKEEESHINQWLQNGFHGEMSYLERNIEKRIDPRILVPNAKTIITVLLNYYPGNPEISTKPPKISRYALGADYHQVLKDKLHLLFKLIKNEFGKVEGRAFVDSAPVLEKSWAVRSGLGWIGKNSLLIHPKLGSYVFIGELILDLDIDASPEEVPNHCGSCTKCVDACPVGAIVSPKVIDARRCISYLTIEKKTQLTDLEKSSLHGWCFGCDICQEVCPWNSKVTISNCKELKPKEEVISLYKDKL